MVQLRQSLNQLQHFWPGGNPARVNRRAFASALMTDLARRAQGKPLLTTGRLCRWRSREPHPARMRKAHLLLPGSLLLGVLAFTTLRGQQASPPANPPFPEKPIVVRPAGEK